MIYLDNAATGGFKPASVSNAVLASLRCCANPGRSGHRLSLALAERVFACRNLLSELFSGYGYERVVFTRSCTEALNIAILGTLKAGDHALCSCLEHNSVLRPLEHLKKTRGVEYDVVPLGEDRRLHAEDFAARVRPNTRVCLVTAASNVTGTAPDLHAIRAALPAHILLFADGAQAAGHIPIDMKKCGLDALAVAGHKGLYAMQGAAALLFSDRVDPEPVLFGGTGSESYNFDMPAFYPDRLEAGTLSYPAIVSLFEGAIFARTKLRSGGENLLRLTASLRSALLVLGYEPFFTPNACGIAAFRHRTLPSEEVAALLSDRFDIAVRAGLHCAPLAHRALGTFPDGLVRASFSPLQSMREVNALVGALKKL